MKENQKKIILLDQDGVLADYGKGLYALWEKKYPKQYRDYSLPLDSFTCMSTEKMYEKCKEARENLLEIKNSTGLFASLPLVEGAKEAIETLSSLYDVYICTMPRRYAMAECIKEKIEWVEKHLGQSFVEKMIFTRDKTLIKGSVLIDDNPMIGEGKGEKEWTHIVYERPYNKHLTSLPRLTWKGKYKECIEENIYGKK
jgi:5'-nucleotidase